MAKSDKPWWAKKDTLWGGETFEVQENDALLGLKKGDLFRIEKTGNSLPKLIPHRDNEGKWQAAHNKNKPITLSEVTTTKNARAFSMQVKLSASADPQTFYLVERKNGTLAIKLQEPDTPEANGGTASFRR